MICDAPCCDKGMIPQTWSITQGRWRLPCWKCGGTGVIHCCEGERERPDAQDAPSDAPEPR